MMGAGDRASWHGVMAFVTAQGSALVTCGQSRRGHSPGALPMLCIPASPADRQLPCLVVLKLWKGQVVVCSTEMLIACESILSFVKQKNKNAAGFVQGKGPAKQRGVQLHIIHSVPTIYLLAPLS